jgi:hypothetical protein
MPLNVKIGGIISKGVRECSGSDLIHFGFDCLSQQLEKPNWFWRFMVADGGGYTFRLVHFVIS